MTDFWDKIAGVYDLAESINGDVYHEMCAQTERLVPAGAKVLDCAAGTGELSLAAAKNAESVVCTDLSEKMLKNARRKAGFFGADNISFETRNIFDLKDPDNTYDIVIAGNVLHLLKNPQGAVMELYRVLKPGGKLLLPTFTAKNRGSHLLQPPYGSPANYTTKSIIYFKLFNNMKTTLLPKYQISRWTYREHRRAYVCAKVKPRSKPCKHFRS